MTIQVHVGDTKAAQARWISDVRIECAVPAGVGIGLALRVSVALQDAVMQNLREPVCFRACSRTYTQTHILVFLRVCVCSSVIALVLLPINNAFAFICRW